MMFLSPVRACSFLGCFALQVSSNCNRQLWRNNGRVVLHCGTLAVILKKQKVVIQSEANKGLGHVRGHTRANYSGVHLLHALLKLPLHLLHLHSKGALMMFVVSIVDIMVCKVFVSKQNLNI